MHSLTRLLGNVLWCSVTGPNPLRTKDYSHTLLVVAVLHTCIVDTFTLWCGTVPFPDLTELFQNHKFVGCVDQTRALVQHQVGVYIDTCSTVCMIMHLNSDKAVSG